MHACGNHYRIYISISAACRKDLAACRKDFTHEQWSPAAQQRPALQFSFPTIPPLKSIRLDTGA